MKLSDGEKLILLMLTELYEKLDVNGEIEPEFIRSAIFSDKTWSIPWKYVGIPFEDQNTPPVVKEVLDILDMWSFIEYSYSRLNVEEKSILVKMSDVFGKNPKFKGFDGNHETEYMSTAMFLVNDLDRFSEFKGRDFNSHMSVVDAYSRMLEKYSPIVDRSYHEPLTPEQLAEILNEQIHPSNRK